MVYLVYEPNSEPKNNSLDQGGHNGNHMSYKDEILKMLELLDEIYLRYIYKLLKEMIAK